MSTISRSEAGDSVSSRYTVFSCAQYDFAIDIASIQEVLAFPRLTRVPNIKPYIRGVFNLRGKIYSVMEIHQIFGMEAEKETDNTMVILIGKPNEISGIIVDQVKEMITIEYADIHPPSEDIPTDISRYITGYCERETGKVYIINIPRLKNPDLGQKLMPVWKDNCENL